jgi:hypothetical protein
MLNSNVLLGQKAQQPYGPGGSCALHFLSITVARLFILTFKSIFLSNKIRLDMLERLNYT